VKEAGDIYVSKEGKEVERFTIAEIPFLGSLKS